MSFTSFAAVSSHVLSEIMTGVLPPLFRKRVMLNKLNSYNMDGAASDKRKIPNQNALPEAVPSFEGAAVAPSSLSYSAAVELTPVGYKTIVPMSLKAIRRRMPGVTMEGALAAIRSGDPSSLPIVNDAVTLSLDAHLRTAERAGLGLVTGLSRSSGSSGGLLTAATIIDAQTKMLAGDLSNANQGALPHEELAIVIDDIGVAQLRNQLATGTGASLAALWANPQTDLSLFSLSPDTERTGLRGGYAGTAIFAADSMLQVNDATDRFGAIILIGRGGAGEPGSQRGFAEFTEGHQPTIQFEHDVKEGVLNVVADWEWVVGEHTDIGGVELIYKRTVT